MNMNQKASLSKVKQMGRRKGAFGSTATSNMLGWLKGLALDPCQPEASKDSIQKIRKLRKVWRSDNTERNQRKRKLEQFLEGGNFNKASGLAPQNSYELNVKKLSCKQKCSASGLPNFVVMNSYGSDSVLTLNSTCNPKRQCTNSNTSDNSTNWSPYNKDVSFSIDTKESIICSDPLRSENLIFQDPTLEDCSDLISSSNSSSSAKKLQRAVKSLMTDSEEENGPRAVIPVGPKFQAEILEWMGPIDKYGCNSDTESLKWLGTKIWPIKERINTRKTSRVIGRGRPDSCSCAAPGSIDCIKCHTLSARLDLQSNLGPAFLSWKFDEMGEVVSKAWTLKEQHMFESFAKINSLSGGTDFWKAISKHFPSKSRKSILSYYYNVFVPRRMREQTRSSFTEVDSDEDKLDDDDEEDEGDDGEMQR